MQRLEACANRTLDPLRTRESPQRMLNHSAWMWNSERRHTPGDVLIVLLLPAFSVRYHGGRIAETGAIIQPEERGFDLVDSCRTRDRWLDLKIANRAWPSARESGRRMLEIGARFPYLAFGIPGFAPDEHL